MDRIPNYKVIKQYIIKGIDGNYTPEELLMNIRPPPEWGIRWTPPFEISRLKRNIHFLRDDGTSSLI